MQRYETPEKQIMRGNPECPPAPRRTRPPTLPARNMADPENPSPPRRPILETARAAMQRMQDP